ncbi:MAG TPA: cupin domain-containing protein [Candidatus Saccharimonadaceae bacterium]|nr:cupin domain-containing protein [Candidatus Saccharimonadaceae bacterium]
MKIWQKGDGVHFRNSAVCFGEVFAPDGAPLDLAVVTVEGRYPESGYIYNDEAHEMAYVAEGRGVFLAKGDNERVVSTGDVVYCEPGAHFAWRAEHMVLIIPCSPQFDPRKHHEDT